MVYDPVRDRLLIFGGFSGTALALTNEVWALALGATPALSQITTSGTPPAPRQGASMIYDSVRDRLVVFGGNGQGSYNDVWALSLTGTPTWSQIVPTGTLPAERYLHSAIYDATRDRMVVFGGSDATSTYLGDVWAVNFSGTPSWTQMTPAGGPPTGRETHTAVYDGPRDRMVVFGGYSGELGELNDTWALSLAGTGTWSAIAPGGGGPPPTRYGHAAVVDAPRNRMIVFGGFSDLEPYRLGDVWTLSFTNPIRWTQLAPSGPTPVAASFFASAYDGLRQQMIAFSADEFWALGGLAGTPSWSMLTPPGQIPRRRWGATAIYDAPRQRMLMFGGYAGPEGVATNDLWAISLNGGGNWTRVVPSGAPPSARFQSTAIYDPIADRMILFGGGNDVGYLNDTWQLSLGGSPAWTQLSPTGTPPIGRYTHTAILDAPRNRMIVHGGYHGDGLDDTWALSLAGATSWSQLAPSGGPAPAVSDHAAVFDAPRDRMLVIGGNGGGSTVWALTLAGSPAWSTLTATGTPPQSLVTHVAAYDAIRDRMLVSMGEAVTNATHALTLSGTPAWGALGSVTPLPDGRSLAASLYDTGSDRWVVFGGIDYISNPPFRNDVVALSFPASYPLNVSVSPIAGGTVQQNPTGECHLSGAMVTLTAAPAANYAFIGWSGDASGTTNPLTVTMDAAKNITANFDNYSLNVTVAPPGTGTVAKNPNLPFYPPNSDVILTATPATGYGFLNWSGDATGSTNPLTVTMTASKNITANFAGYPVNVAISPTGSGNVTKNPNHATYAPGSQVTLTAGGPYPFLGWTGDATGAANPLIITVDGPKSITASFQAYTVTTAISPTGSGTVSKTPNQTVYASGVYVQLGGLPSAGYAFDHWSGDLTGTSLQALLLVNGNKSVTAHFTIPPPTCGGWSLIDVATKPSGRRGAATAWDPIRHGMLMFGGEVGLGSFSDQVWRLTTGGTPTWTQLTPTGTPGGRSVSSAFYDPIRDRLLIYGGNNGGFSGGHLNDVWALSLAGTPAWAQIIPSGTPPPGPRTASSIIYDPLRDRIVLFGGAVRCGSACYVPQNDVWQLTLAGTPTWTQLMPAGAPPPPRLNAGAIYDPARDRMVILAGDGTNPNGAWALSLSGTPTWANLNPVGTPHVTSGFQAIYDPVRDRAILMAGDGSSKVSLLDFKNQPTHPLWAQANPAGAGPGSRPGLAAIYEPDQDLAVLFGGSSSPYLDSSMRLDLGGGFFVDAGGTNGSVNIYEWCYGPSEVATLFAVAAQGYTFNQWLGDAAGTDNPVQITVNGYKVVEAEFVAATTDVEAPPVTFALGRVHPNPSPGRAQIEYSLPHDSWVRVRVFDVTGREVARLVEGSRPAGNHVATWDAAIDAARAGAGVYLVRFEIPGRTWVKRLALLR